VRKGFSLLELLAVLGLLGVLAALSFPAWRALLNSGSRRTAEARIMEAVEHARTEAISSGREIWVVFRHNASKGPDAERIMAREGGKIVPLGGWERLPRGIAFHLGSKAITDAHPPREIQEAALNSGSREDSLGAVMFLRTGTVGWPKPGAESLIIPLCYPEGSSTITLSRGTGRASLSKWQGGNP
jgi:prepilin-type N-terminal cleavage/methylation domain-containing protein